MTQMELLHMYDDVGFFSADGICWACKGNLWFHINLDGTPIYRQRYQRVYSFTEDGLALVYLAGQGWLHIRKDGNPAYKQRYTYASNFFKRCC